MARMFLSFLSMPGLKSREYGSTPPAIYSIGWLDTKNDQNLLGHFSGVGTSNRMDDDCCFFFKSNTVMYLGLVIANNFLYQVVPSTRLLGWKFQNKDMTIGYGNHFAYRNCW